MPLKRPIANFSVKVIVLGQFGNIIQYRALQGVIQHVSLHNIFFILVLNRNVNLHIKNANCPMYESGVKSGCKSVNDWWRHFALGEGGKAGRRAPPGMSHKCILWLAGTVLAGQQAVQPIDDPVAARRHQHPAGTNQHHGQRADGDIGKPVGANHHAWQ